MPKSAQPLMVSDQDAPTLRRWTRSSSIRAGLAQRARIVLAAAEGLSNTEIAERVGCSRPTVIRWRSRYAAKGLAGLDDQPRSGRPRTVRRDRRAEIVATTQQPPPQQLGITHWSTRSLAKHLGVSRMTVARVWAEHDLTPWRVETFKFSTDLELHAKVEDLCGLYLDPPAGEPPELPLRPGLAERRTHNYVRHGVTDLFAALETATGKVVGRCFARHRHDEFLVFLKQVARAWPRRELHVVVDNASTHSHAEVTTWLTKQPRISLHFTPTSASWMNQVETFFGLLTRQALRRGSFTGVPDLVAAIGRYIAAWNADCRPFAWVKDADQILVKAASRRRPARLA
jgi:transposase